MSERLVLTAISVIASSGVPGLFLSRHSLAGQWIAVVLAVAGSLVGIVGTLNFAILGDAEPISYGWAVPGGELAVAVDGISAVFLLPIFLIPMLGSIYGLSYWRQSEHAENGRKLRLFYGLVTASLALVVVAQNAVLFLMAWEIMALSAFFLVTTEDEDESVRDAGWVYLVATHSAALCLFAMFALLRSVVGSFAMVPLPEGSITPGMANAVFLLALTGFGLKAGIMPLHVWLPGAHAMAPSHVSALMSGVLIKIGIYGLVRIFSFFPDPPAWWGGLVLALGTISGVLGVAFAIGQHDLKRLLAYHSVENIGIIVMGIGLAMIGRSVGRTDWIVLGLAGGLLHVWNHGLFKSLLFLSAGSVIHAVHTREIDQLGGLAKRMPVTALAFGVGAVAICGLPPLNGFVSEFLIYLGLLRTVGIGDGHSWAGAAFAAPALALIGALAVSCFVKAFGGVFLGSGRSKHVDHAHESRPSMTGPMVVLMLGCVVIGVAPSLVAPLLDRAITAWVPALPANELQLAPLAPLGWISVMGLGLIGVIIATSLYLRYRLLQREVGLTETWSCGYVAPSPTMQYTSSSFAEMLVRLWAWVLRPKVRQNPIEGLFAHEGRFASDVPDPVLDGMIRPSFQSIAWLLSRFRVLQQGSIQLYLFYVFVALLALLLWSAW
ncbi:MAG: proton-conducting transporter membrane subunit [Planctomycetaceae bacterium]